MWNNCKDHLVCVAQLLAVGWGGLNIFTLIHYQQEVLALAEYLLDFSFLGVVVISVALLIDIMIFMVLMLGPGWCKDHGCPMAYKGGIFIPRQKQK